MVLTISIIALALSLAFVFAHRRAVPIGTYPGPARDNVVPEKIDILVPGSGDVKSVRADTIPIPGGEYQDDYLLWLREQSDIRRAGGAGDADYDEAVKAFI